MPTQAWNPEPPSYVNMLMYYRDIRKATQNGADTAEVAYNLVTCLPSGAMLDEIDEIVLGCCQLRGANV
ncbi:hypothetical protein CVT26_009676 [Gymnopilus dilepis]|uniref:Uncharacterized protein n=1 Tax=Gymnopilus dilepis TaxID=231916 RepID=A0A409YBK5_9AGAR|nr:hypothetical protein CVT26_009676 [Gymnopilus dilepis]